MNRKMMIIIGAIVVVVAAIAAFMLFSPDEDSNASKIDIIGNGTIEENGTLNVKLTNGNGTALKDKDVHISVKDSNGSVVFETSAKTYVNGIANLKLDNLSAGEYEINATFDGDENYTASSVSKKIVITPAEVQEDADSDVKATDATNDDTYQSQYSSSSYSNPSNYVPSDSGSSDDYYDENGNPSYPSYDENGNIIG